MRSSESLALTWEIIHFKLYLHGDTLVAGTDHLPPVPMLNNAYSNPPLRIEKLILKLQEYNFTVLKRQRITIKW